MNRAEKHTPRTVAETSLWSNGHFQTTIYLFILLFYFYLIFIFYV